MDWSEITAAIGAALLGGGLAGYLSARSAVESWRRARQDMVDKQAVDTIQKLSTDLAGLSHCAMWLTWRAKHDPVSLEKYISRYEEDTYLKVPSLLGNLAALAAIDDKTSDSLHKFVARICKLDGAIAEAAIEVRAGNVAPLASLCEESHKFYEELLTTLSCSAAKVLKSRSGAE